MLPNYIIDEIKRREQEKELKEELFIECPLPDNNENMPSSSPSDEETPERGIAILDFDI